MKNAILLHGAGETPNSYWLPWLKKELERRSYTVWSPQLPGTENPRLKEQLAFVLTPGALDKETVIIGHSAGCPLTLSVLERISVRVRQAILIAGFCSPLPDGPNDILQPSYDWKKINAHVGDIIFIHSNNDPWGCDDQQGRVMFGHLGGTLIIRHGEGHMGSERFNQPYPKFPLLLKLIT